MEVSTQWRIGMAGATGLDVPGCQSTWALLGVQVDPDTFAGVQIMERAALSAWPKASE
jgi:hypothetical protein